MAASSPAPSSIAVANLAEVARAEHARAGRRKRFDMSEGFINSIDWPESEARIGLVDR
jgi:hypothetical protein